MAIIEKLEPGMRALPFQAWRRDVHSQTGEDGLLEQLLAALGVKTGYFVEFGAWDGKHLSNCAKLAEEGWSGCFIEADPHRFTELEKNYHDEGLVTALNRTVSVSGSDSLDNILAGISTPREFGVLSIDVDGPDYLIWESLRDYRPTICVVEFNPTVPANIIYIQEIEDRSQCGSSLAAFCRLASEKGYSLAAVTEWNAIFVLTADCLAHGIATYRPEEVKSTEYELALMHGYDGTMVAIGHRELLWHGVQFGPEYFQALPSELRRFPIGQSDDYYQALAARRLELG